MYVNVKDKFLCDKFLVVDLDNRKAIRYVQWADDKSGDYAVLEVDADGVIFDDDGNPRITKKNGNIKLIKIDKDMKSIAYGIAARGKIDQGDK